MAAATFAEPLHRHASSGHSRVHRRRMVRWGAVWFLVFGWILINHPQHHFPAFFGTDAAGAPLSHHDQLRLEVARMLSEPVERPDTAAVTARDVPEETPFPSAPTNESVGRKLHLHTSRLAVDWHPRQPRAWTRSLPQRWADATPDDVPSPPPRG